MTPPATARLRSPLLVTLAALRLWHRKLIASVDHEAVIGRIVEESGWTPRYIFMTMMSAGIAVLGLLLSSPAVVIGAMLISPLMSPILGLGFSLALFDFTELRRSLLALALGSAVAVLFTMLIVLASPLKATTVEILARTRPNLFDLLVALFAALAGTFAIIRGRGETIVGVAIATALMPPLAVVGYGIATWNLPVLSGSLALFVTNFVTIGLAATIMARFYGFGHQLSVQQSWTQTWVLVAVFIAMAVPLGVSLAQIGREALSAAKVRTVLNQQLGTEARVTQLEIDFDVAPIAIRSIVITPRTQVGDTVRMKRLIEAELGQPVDLELDEVLLASEGGSLDGQRAQLQAARDAASMAERQGQDIARLVALAAGVPAERVIVDRTRRRIEAQARPLPGAGLESYRALEQRIGNAARGWAVAIVPPLSPMPEIAFADNADTLDEAATGAIDLSVWAARRWNAAALAVPGLPQGAPPERPDLVERRARAVAALLRAQGIVARPAGGGGQRFRLAPAEAGVAAQQDRPGRDP